MKKFVMKEWDDRGTSKVKVSVQKEGEGMKEAIVPKDGFQNFVQNTDWF